MQSNYRYRTGTRGAAVVPSMELYLLTVLYLATGLQKGDDFVKENEQIRYRICNKNLETCFNVLNTGNALL
jgi:hypothetical protein